MKYFIMLEIFAIISLFFKSMCLVTCIIGVSCFVVFRHSLSLCGFQDAE